MFAKFFTALIVILMVTAWRAVRMTKAIVGEMTVRVRQNTNGAAAVECKLPGKMVYLNGQVTPRGSLVVDMGEWTRATDGSFLTPAEHTRLKKKLPAALKKLRIPFDGYVQPTGSLQS